jgi:hypothetical protein
MHTDLSWLKQLLVITGLIAFLGLGLWNGLIMLFSPATWLRMPKHLAFHGGMRRERTSNLQVRLVGFAFSAAVVWMVVMIIHRGLTGSPRVTFEQTNPGTSPHPINTILGLAVCGGLAFYGVIMILRPRRWIEKYRPEGLPQESAKAAGALVATRISGVLAVLGAIFFAWKLAGPTP